MAERTAAGQQFTPDSDQSKERHDAVLVAHRRPALDRLVALLGRRQTRVARLVRGAV
jgi:hypothetical protein